MIPEHELQSIYKTARPLEAHLVRSSLENISSHPALVRTHARYLTEATDQRYSHDPEMHQLLVRAGRTLMHMVNR